mgnify:CR=1 FL=1
MFKLEIKKKFWTKKPQHKIEHSKIFMFYKIVI